jgi:hypothetical protein
MRSASDEWCRGSQEAKLYPWSTFFLAREGVGIPLMPMGTCYPEPRGQVVGSHHTAARTTLPYPSSIRPDSDQKEDPLDRLERFYPSTSDPSLPQSRPPLLTPHTFHIPLLIPFLVLGISLDDLSGALPSPDFCWWSTTES